MDLIEWLQKAPEFPKLYWQDKESQKITAGFGATEILTEIPRNKETLFFGVAGSASLEKDEIWKDLHSPFFFLQKHYALL